MFCISSNLGRERLYILECSGLLVRRFHDKIIASTDTETSGRRGRLPATTLSSATPPMPDPRPAKKSRVVYSEPDPSPSAASSEAVTVSCTNNNARRLQLAHSVTIRLQKNRRIRRQGQSAHKVLHASHPTNTEIEDIEMGSVEPDNNNDGGALDAQGPQTDGASDAPKRPVVRVSSKVLRQVSNPIFFRQGLVKIGCLIARYILTSSTVKTPWGDTTGRQCALAARIAVSSNALTALLAVSNALTV